MIQQNIIFAIMENDQNKLIEQIKLHKQIKECFELLNDIISPILFLRLMFMASGVCILGFEISVVNQKSLFFFSKTIFNVRFNSREL